MSENNQSHWIPLSDLMTGLMMVFMLIAIVFMLRVEQTTTLVVQELEQTKKELLQALQSEFAKNIKQWDAEILGDMTIRFKNPNSMFKTGKYELTDEFKSTLVDFFPRYMKIVSSEKFAPSIKEIILEGHTSPESYIDSQYKNKNIPDNVKEYLTNMDLAQDRCNATNEFLYEIPATVVFHDLMMKKLHLHDVSSSYPVLKENGEIDSEHSRRVEFKIVTNAEERMANIAAVLNAK